MTRGERAILLMMAFGMIGVLAVTGSQVALAGMNRTANQGQLVHELTRACTPATGAPVRLQATTGTDADSGALDAWTGYRLECDTDAWVRFGTSAVNAVANDNKYRAALPEYFSTSGTVVHVSALSVSTNGDCRLTKCL